MAEEGLLCYWTNMWWKKYGNIAWEEGKRGKKLDFNIGRNLKEKNQKFEVVSHFNYTIFRNFPVVEWLMFASSPTLLRSFLMITLGFLTISNECEAFQFQDKRIPSTPQLTLKPSKEFFLFQTHLLQS